MVSGDSSVVGAGALCNPDMEKLNHLELQSGISLVSYGVRISIRVNELAVLDRLSDYLPPGWEPSSSPNVDELYSLIVGQATPGSPHSYHRLYHEQEKIAQAPLLEDIFDTLSSDLCLRVGLSVQDKLFVHAGVVGWRGWAIVIPGRSFSGKTTLVAAMVQAGARYYSDEYAIFDPNGLVHPYPRSLAIRQKANERKKKCSVEELGGEVGTEPLPVGVVVHTQYHLGARWCPRQISTGQAVLSLLDNTIVARTRTQFALSIQSRAVSGALALEGKRGEATDVAVALLQQLENWLE